jgi:hypothetical protein
MPMHDRRPACNQSLHNYTTSANPPTWASAHWHPLCAQRASLDHLQQQNLISALRHCKWQQQHHPNMMMMSNITPPTLRCMHPHTVSGGHAASLEIKIIAAHCILIITTEHRKHRVASCGGLHCLLRKCRPSNSAALLQQEQWAGHWVYPTNCQQHSYQVLPYIAENCA